LHFCAWPHSPCARIQIPDSTIDLTEYIPKAPTIFRGTVVDSSIVEDDRIPAKAIARLEVQRWYRGEEGPAATVYYGVGGIAGHNCIDLKPGTQWLIFATEQNGHLEFVDDCYGAVADSPLIAPSLPHPDMLAQLEVDFEAGLDDPNPANRLVGIQRLGGSSPHHRVPHFTALSKTEMRGKRIGQRIRPFAEAIQRYFREFAKCLCGEKRIHRRFSSLGNLAR
jgi:hypothetical protein